MEQRVSFELGQITAGNVVVSDIKVNVEFKCDEQTASKLCEVGKEYFKLFGPILQRMAMNA